MENTSGQGKAAIVPDEVKGLAWGAFLWSWIWGLFNRTWIALLIFVPIVGLVMWVMLLLKGREWAWRNKHWDSVEHFNMVQRRWAKAGLIVLFVPLLLGIVAAIVIPMMANDAGQKITETPNSQPATISTKKPAPSAVASAPAKNTVPDIHQSEKADTKLSSTSPTSATSGSVLVSDEPEAVYAKFHKAGLTSNFDEMLRYGTSQPELKSMSATERLAMLEFLAQILPKTYTVVRKAIGPDGNHATLHLDAAGAAGTITFVKENGVWKVANANWGGSSQTAAPSPDMKAANVAGMKTKQQPSIAEDIKQPQAVTDKKGAIAAAPDSPYRAAPENAVTPKFNDVMTAVMRQDQAAVTQLLDLGWWVDKPGSNGFTPLMEAVMMSDAPMAELLLKRGANPNAAAGNGSTLQIAKRNRDAAMAELLRRYGATVE